MVADRALRFSIYDRDYVPVGWVNNPLQAEVSVRHNDISTCTFDLDEDHEYAEALSTPGTRVLVEYLQGVAARRLMSGVVAVEGNRDGRIGVLSFSVVDDKSLFWTLLGWPNPTGTIEQQGDESAYYRSTGPAETVVKDLVNKNKGRIYLPVTVAPNQARGGDVDVQIRMHPLAERMLPAVDLAGVGIDCWQSGSGVRVDVYVPEDQSERDPLTEASGVVLQGTWSQEPPTCTRVVVAGPGEGKARKFLVMPQTLPSPLEQQWGVSIEAEVDARDLDEASSTLTADMQRRGQTALDEGASRVSVQATLQEIPGFEFGDGYSLGDIVPVQLIGAPVIKERVRAVNFSLTKDDGLVVTPTIGLDGSFENWTVRNLARLAAGVRDLKVSY